LHINAFLRVFSVDVRDVLFAIILSRVQELGEVVPCFEETQMIQHYTNVDRVNEVVLRTVQHLQHKLRNVTAEEVGFGCEETVDLALLPLLLLCQPRLERLQVDVSVA